MTEILHSALICCCGNTVADRLLTSKEATEKALHEATDCPRGQLSTVSSRFAGLTLRKLLLSRVSRYQQRFLHMMY